MAITPEKIKELKFPPLTEHDYSAGSKHTSLPGFSESSNMYYNCVTIFTDSKRDNYGGPRWTQYTVKVCGDKYGETADEVVLPRGATLKDAKQKAYEMAAEYAKQGLLYA